MLGTVDRTCMYVNDPLWTMNGQFNDLEVIWRLGLSGLGWKDFI